MSKKSGTKTIDILLEFPSFIASIELLSRVSGHPSKRGRYERYRPHHSFTVCFPECVVLVEYGPVPCRPVVRLIYVDPTSEEFDEQIGVVENRQMHNIHCENIRHWKGLVRQTTE